MNIKKFKIKISNKLILSIIPIMLIQLLLPVRSIALFLIEDLKIPYLLLISLESLTVPITTLVLCIYLIQKLNRKWISKEVFCLGFVLIYIFHVVLLNAFLLELDIFNLLFNKHLLDFYKYIFALFDFFVDILDLIFVGWSDFKTMILAYFFQVFVILPILSGIIFSLFYGLIKYRSKIHRKEKTTNELK